jgi:hypothetical protein
MPHRSYRQDEGNDTRSPRRSQSSPNAEDDRHSPRPGSSASNRIRRQSVEETGDVESRGPSYLSYNEIVQAAHVVTINPRIPFELEKDTQKPLMTITVTDINGKHYDLLDDLALESIEALSDFIMLVFPHCPRLVVHTYLDEPLYTSQVRSDIMALLKSLLPLLDGTGYEFMFEIEHGFDDVSDDSVDTALLAVGAGVLSGMMYALATERGWTPTIELDFERTWGSRPGVGAGEVMRFARPTAEADTNP